MTLLQASSRPCAIFSGWRAELEHMTVGSFVGTTGKILEALSAR
jgi:hypothetical protein